jgi:hypothetical protein
MSSTVVIPPVPVGDPDGMEQLAGICRSAAATIGALANDVTALPKGMTFEGPGARAFLGRMHSVGGGISTAAHQLQDYAGRLDAAAAEVRRLIAERNAALERLADEQRLAAFKVLP